MAELSVTGSAPSGFRPGGPGAQLGPLVSAEQAWKMLETKFSARYKTVRRAFMDFDTDKDGQVNLREFRTVIAAMGIYLNGSEFRKLWSIFDKSGDGNISYTEFNNKMGLLISPYFEGIMKQMRRPETPKVKDWQKRQMAKALSKKIMDIEEAFNEIDTDGSGRISHPEFMQALRRVGLNKIGFEEGYMMMQRFKRKDNDTGEMTLEEFRDCMTEYMKIDTKVIDESERPNAVLSTAMEALRSRLPKDPAAVAALFHPFDPKERGEVDYPGFNRGLQSVGINLTPEQLGQLVIKYDGMDEGIILYEMFAADITGVGAAPGKRASGPASGSLFSVFKPWALQGIRPMIDLITGRPYERRELAQRIAPRLGLSVAETRLVQALVGRKESLAEGFRRFDRSGTGSLTKRDMERALLDLQCDVDDETMENLFLKYDADKDGVISYAEFSHRLGPLLSTEEANLKRLGLERVGKEAAGGADLGPSGSPIAGAPSAKGSVRRPRMALSPPRDSSGQYIPVLDKDGLQDPKAYAAKLSGAAGSGLNALRASRGAAGGGARAAMEEDGMSVATADVDLSATAAKMRRILGRHMGVVAEDIKRKAAAEGGIALAGSMRRGGAAGASTMGGTAARTSSITGGAVGGGGAFVRGEILRDVLAEKGVALTSKEMRALALRYGPGGAGGAPVPRELPGHEQQLPPGAVDIDRMLREASAPRGRMSLPAVPRPASAHVTGGGGRRFAGL